MVSLLTYRIALFSSLILLIALLPRRDFSSHPFLRSRAPSYPALLTLPILESILAIPSPSGHERDVLLYVASLLRHHNFSVQVYPIDPLTSSHPPRVNVLALHGAAQIADVRVVMFTHLDVVGGDGDKIPPGMNQEDIIVGRGSVDAKGQAAGMIETFGRIRDKRLALMLVCGEERDHAGVKEMSKMEWRDDVVLVNGEPTEGKLGTGSKGMQRGRLVSVGKECHSGYMEFGESATAKLVRALGRMLEEDWGEASSVNVGKLEGGGASNVVAGWANAEFMFRIVGDRERVRKKVEEIGNEEGVEVEWSTGNDGVEYWTVGLEREFGETTLSYNTDVGYWNGNRGKAVLFGVGSILRAHTESEWVSKKEMSELSDKLEKIVGAILQEMEV